MYGFRTGLHQVLVKAFKYGISLALLAENPQEALLMKTP